MKKLLINLGILTIFLFYNTSYANSTSLLFDVTSSDTTLNIKTFPPNHTYSQAGIKITTSGYTLKNPGTECTPNKNGYCLFSANDKTPAAISINGSTGKMNITLCLNGSGPLSCQNYSISVNATPPPSIARYLYVASPYGSSTDSVFVCTLNSSDGAIVSCQNAGGGTNLDGSNPQGIALNNTGTIAYMTNGNGTSNVYQCNINPIDGTFNSCALPISINTTNGYQNGYGMLALNQQNTIAYLVNNINSSPEVISCNITSGNIDPNCFDAGATNITDSGEGIALNSAGTVAYIADYSSGLFVCSVSGLSVQTSCTLINTVGSITIQGPSDVALNPSENLVYVADYSSNKIYGCTTSFTNCFTANQNISHPAGIVINATNTTAYVTNFGNSVYYCPILSDGTFPTCTSVSPAGLSGAVGVALSY